MPMTRLALAALGLPLLAAGALAHHGWGSYDSGKVLKITAPVESLQWQNPHVHVMVPHEGKSWEAVLAPPFRMEARGLAPDMIKAGTSVTLEGYPSTKIPTELRVERITVGAKTFELR